MNVLTAKLRLYWSLIKSLQTGLLLATGLAGYMSARCPLTHWSTLLGLAGSLFLAISGSTILNMWYDRDIDAMMKRTARRPIPSGSTQPGEALLLGLAFSAAGVAWAVSMSPLYGAVVFAGLFFDVIVYTVWLKRRTPWSIVWGGIAGGMPILAGRVLGTGQLDWIGGLMALSILFWIPTHILTFCIRYSCDYATAQVPTFPSVYGERTTRTVVAVSSVLAAAAIAGSAVFIGMAWGHIGVLAVLSAGLLGLAVWTIRKPSEKAHFGLFKFASLYMLSAMVLFVIEGFL